MFHFSKVIYCHEVLEVIEVLVFSDSRAKLAYDTDSENKGNRDLAIYRLMAVKNERRNEWEARIMNNDADLLSGNNYFSSPADALKHASVTLNSEINLSLLHFHEEVNSLSGIINNLPNESKETLADVQSTKS